MASSLTKDSASTPGSEKTFFGHPRGLATLFMTEMWERFSFYGMKALLPLYLVAPGGMDMNAATATAIFSIYMAMVYLLALPGGWFADRLWGPRKTITIAALVIMLGHLTLALPGQAMFFLGLVFVAIGSGLLKANISTMVGHLYNGPDDPRRDGGFTVFYIGINLGAFFAPLAIGTVGEKVNWHLGFAIAAFGMGLGLIQFLLGGRHLSPQSSVVPKPVPRAELMGLVRKAMLWIIAAVVFYGVAVATDVYTLNWAIVPITVSGLLIPIWVLTKIKRDKSLNDTEQSKMTAYIWFFVAAAIFWMIYDQGASTVALFGKNSTDTSIFGFDFPVSWFQSVNPVLIMAMAPVVAWIWLALNRRGQEPNSVVKFASGLFLVGISFFVFLIPLSMAGDGDKVGAYWIVAIYFVHTIGELCVSPVGLSVTTKMAPEKYASQMLGVWFLAVTAGDCTTGLLSIAGVDLNKSGVVAMEATMAIIAAVAVFMYRKKVKALMGDVH
ncbi:oligopeptide:H+ symporter [Streptomyces spectabilis]|uniref:MFS transporter n=1 Tax=Streptomyces spectabilis TaxID=68270 RepID=A0A5P2XBK8_STRST|nr:oligopeptide:H+ symporter [Streptomyces spectabilis]MBB5107722.1 POT family proton-dependent oligopeptide transporter [Streptomyces spectabilis]MCI3903161.1 oligopeptide:H+ symporter [Streptomyces spectabilis]QEV60400.1 MFS transporter [Streptomyces spectabilis]GGV38263.1 MFS transporter [Streptomyces spectabilis]